MQGSEFRKWAEHSCQYYGSDPWFFLRELAQNSRDASAQTIWVKAEHTSDEKEILIFEDDGCGMSYEHACRYLFCLYASSKTNEKSSAGMYGSGFWTVLRYKPKDIIIESRNRKNRWAISLDASFNVKKVSCMLDKQGTRITLIREAQFENHVEFQKGTERALIRYCSYLRRNNRRFNQLPVIFLGRDITKPLKLPGPVTLTFRDGPVEGAVGLGRQPKVYLYARGLPVWEGTVLEELSHSLPYNKKDSEIGWGLAPVFLLNGNHLDVTISRNATIDNQAFKKVRRAAQRSLSKLIQFYSEKAFPKKWTARLLDSFKRTSSQLLHSPMKLFVLLLIIIIPLELVILSKLYPPNKSKSRAQSIFHVEKNHYTGAAVIRSSTGIAVDMLYQPPMTTWFKIFTADLYDIKSGFVRDPNQYNESFSFPVQPETSTISIQLGIKEGGKIFLPQPIGYIIDSESIILNRTSWVSPRFSVNREAIIHIPEKGGLIQYRCYLIKQKKLLNFAEISRLTRLPENFEFPAPIGPILNESSRTSIDERIKKALALTSLLLKYDRSAQTVSQYDRLTEQLNWFQRVLHIGKGDCDIINGVTVLFLRKMGIPARLVVGLVGKKGKIQQELHAWTEYFNRGWQTVDASQFTTLLQETQPARAIQNQFGDRVKRTSPSMRGISGETKNYIPYLSLGTIFSLSIILFYFVKQRKRQEIFKTQDSNTIKENLSQMAIRALLEPRIWGGHESNIWYSRIIPTLNGKSISLKQALRLAKEGKLFVGKNKHKLALIFINAGIPVLDLSNRVFAPLIRMLPGAIELDKIARLEAISPEKIKNDNVARLLVHVNQVFKKIRKVHAQCMWASGLNNHDLYDVNLPQFSRVTDTSWPMQFIAVNPESPRIKSIGNVFQKNPTLGVYRLIKYILQESGFFFVSKDKIHKKASILLLKEIV